MARTIVTNGDKIRLAIGGCNFGTAITIAVLMQHTAAGDGTWQQLLSQLTSAGAVSSGYHLEKSGAGNLDKVALDTNGGVPAYSTTTTTSADGWVLHTVTKASGVVAPRYHRYKYSTNTFVHETMSTTLSDATAPGSSGLIDIGGDYGGAGDNSKGDYAVAGLWDRVLSDAEVENLPFALTNWYASAPAGLWMLDQAATTQKVVDLAGGGANESSLTGTSVATASVPVFNYGDGVWTPTIVKPAGGTTFNDSGSGTITLSSGTTSQSMTHTASGSGTITLSGAFSQSQTHTATGTGTITLSGTSTGTHVYSDSGTGTITLSGTSTQSVTHTATGSGTIVLSGTGTENFVPPGGVSTPLRTMMRVGT